jgi:transposase-like protein
MKRSTPASRAKLVAAYRASGLTQAEFAERRGINVATLQSWLYRRDRRAARPSVEPVTFLEVRGAERPTTGHVALVLGDVRVELEALPPPAYLAELYRSLC